MSESDVDEGDEEGGGASKKKADQKMKGAIKYAELDALLAVPLTSPGFSGKYPTKTGRLEMPNQFGESTSKSAIHSLQKDAENTKELLKSNRSKKRKKNFQGKSKKSH